MSASDVRDVIIRGLPGGEFDGHVEVISGRSRFEARPPKNGIAMLVVNGELHPLRADSARALGEVFAPPAILHSDRGHSTVDELRAAINREKQEVTRLRARVEELEQTDVVALRALAAQVIEAKQPGLHEEDILAFLYVIADDAQKLLAKTFTPSARQLELMEHAVGGAARHRNHFYAAKGNAEQIDGWRALVAAGLAIEPWGFDQANSVRFEVSPAGLAVLDARARPRIMEAKARSWDVFRDCWMAWERDPVIDDDDLASLVREFLERHVTYASPTKGPRAIAEEIVSALSEHGFALAQDLGSIDGDGRITDRISEIIGKALGGAS